MLISAYLELIIETFWANESSGPGVDVLVFVSHKGDLVGVDLTVLGHYSENFSLEVFALITV